jgi:peptidoglycan/LPS O-acetylase OafA/YrhL
MSAQRAASGLTGADFHSAHRRDIDGLRAIAILSVLGYHANSNWLPGGFVGVDIFFVLSGYLISGIIFNGLQQSRFSFGDFYARRIKRIFPALLLVLVSVCLFGWLALFTDEYQMLGAHVAAGAGFVSNIVLWREAGYFDPAADLKPLLHLWSLVIE